MNENITLKITEKHVTFDPVVQVKTIAARNNNSKGLKPHPPKKQLASPRIGLQFVK